MPQGRCFDWKGMAGLRNYVVHNYAEVDLFRVWDIAIAKIPHIEKRISEIIAAVKSRKEEL